MNKKLIALAMVLLLAVGGLFAAITLPGNGNTSVTAILKATLGSYFYHGIVEGSDFIGTKNILNAFSATTSPSFQYGYETNAAGLYYIRMAVSDFDNVTEGAEGTVKIKNITVSGGGATKIWDDVNSSYVIFTVPTTNTYTRTTTTITVEPALTATDTTDHRGNAIAATETAAQATPGEYEATISFSVSAS
jgi:predicted RNA-binding protein with TRAM domain